MSNNYYTPDPSGLPTGLPGFNLRRSSYASAATSNSPGGYGRSGATFQQLLNTTNADGTDSNGVNNHSSLRPPYGSHNTSSANLAGGGNSDDNDADPMWGGINTSDSALLRLLGSRSHQLPSFSRAFEPFLRGTSPYDLPGIVPNNNTGFFTPSYLRESVYVQRLEEQYNAKMQSSRESQQLRQPPTASPGAGVPGSSSGMMVGAGTLGGMSGRPHSTSLSGGGFGGLDYLSNYASLTSISINTGAGAGLGNGKIGGPGSHRGLSYDVVEKGSGSGSGSGLGLGLGGSSSGLADDEEPIAPLPSRWDKDDKASSLDVLSDGLDVKFAGSRSGNDHGQHAQEAGSVRADHYMPPQCGIYYYEVTILSKKREESTIGIGFSEATAKLSRPPGWEPGSWGYHSDDGNVFTDHGSGKKYGPSFGPGDIVGCGVNFRTGTAFFTKNGEDLGIAFKDIKADSKLFPSIGLKKMGEHVRVNFGQVPFTFDIDGVMKNGNGDGQGDGGGGNGGAPDLVHAHGHFEGWVLPNGGRSASAIGLVIDITDHHGIEGFGENDRIFVHGCFEDDILPNGTINESSLRLIIHPDNNHGDFHGFHENDGPPEAPPPDRTPNLGLYTNLDGFSSSEAFLAGYGVDVSHRPDNFEHCSLADVLRILDPMRDNIPESLYIHTLRAIYRGYPHLEILEELMVLLLEGRKAHAVYLKEKLDIKQQILKTKTDKLAPDTSETDLVQQLVLQFLQHDGYVDTARAFAKEIEAEKEALNIDSKHPVEAYNIADDEDANKRQRIRAAVLDGNIDRALELTKADYPTVLERNEAVHFRVKTRKFIEMIRSEAELNIAGNGAGSANGTNNTNGNGAGDARQTNGNGGPQMDVDDDMMMVEDNNSNSNNGGGAPAGQALVQNAVKYGQQLQVEFQSDSRPKMRNALNEVFSLLAYTNPLKQPEVEHLLDQRGRVAVAEELNSAILQSLGKSSRSALENLYAQTNVLLDDLRQTGGPGAFVTIQDTLDEIQERS